MKNKLYSACLLFISALAVVSGCDSPENASLTESSLKYSDPFDDPSITDGFLEENLCMVFENLRFVKGEEKDHMFVVDDGTISLHKSYAKKKASISAFEAVKGLSLSDALDQIGTPSFRGRYDTLSLSYVISTSSYVNVNVEKDEKGVWKVISYEQYDEKSFSDYFERRYEPGYQATLYQPSPKRISSIKMGWRFDDALFVLGMPESGVYDCVPSDKVCGGTWRLDNSPIKQVIVRTRWIGSDYPLFDINNCQDGISTYCGVIDVYIQS